MSDPIAPLGCGNRNVQDTVNAAIEIRPDASATRASVAEDQTGHHWYMGFEAVEAVATLTELLSHQAAGAAAAGAGPVSGVFAYGFLIDHAYTEGDRQNLELMDDVARGAFAALEGRMDDPAVRAEASRNLGFAEGLRRVEAFSRMHPDQLPILANAVRASKRGGMLAVARGQEDSAAFRERADSDAAFAHGAEYMSRLRDADPEAFAQKAAWLEGLATDVEDNRRCQVRG